MVSLDIYSMAVGVTLEEMIWGTASMADFISGKGTSRLRDTLGRGTSFSTASVMMHSVPSEPMTRSFRLYPELFLATAAPKVCTSPLGSTTVRART